MEFRFLNHERNKVKSMIMRKVIDQTKFINPIDSNYFIFFFHLLYVDCRHEFPVACIDVVHFGRKRAIFSPSNSKPVRKKELQLIWSYKLQVQIDFYLNSNAF